MPEIVREVLIDTSPAQTRAALLENGRTAELFFERAGRPGAVGDIFLGHVARVLPGIQAAFVDLGLEKDAFLYVTEVREEGEGFEDLDTEELEQPRLPSSIDDLLKEGEEVLVQVVKEAIGSKGARVSANISLPGRLLVYTPFSPRAGISRRIEDTAERERLQGLLETLAEGTGGFIARTAAQGKEAEDFHADRDYLRRLWHTIEARARNARAPILLHRDQDLALRTVRDLASGDIAAIRVNDAETFSRIIEFLHATEPALVPRVKWHRSGALLFEEFGVEAEIEKAIRGKVWLKSGGYLVINPTEALVAIDVNTGKFTGKDNLEETVFAVNLEAAREIVRQIRLRDLGGILVVDFIDMADEEHRRQLFAAFEAEMQKDRARSHLLPISEFGLIQVTRKRVRAELSRSLTRPCPSCGGGGRIKNPLTLAMEIRREFFKLARSFTAGESALVRARPETADFLRQQEPRILQEIERELEISVTVREDEAVAPGTFVITPL